MKTKDGGSLIRAEGLGTVGPEWVIVEAADMDGDGSPDTLWQKADSTLVIRFMDGGSLVRAASLGIVGVEWAMYGVGDIDINGDGRADIVWRNDAGEVVIWFMDAAAAW